MVAGLLKISLLGCGGSVLYVRHGASTSLYAKCLDGLIYRAWSHARVWSAMLQTKAGAAGNAERRNAQGGAFHAKSVINHIFNKIIK
jgi:hypothetical protein